MMGKSHILTGLAGGMVAAPFYALTGDSLTTAELACCALVTAGASILPDIDHPQATIANSLGPVSKTISKTVNKLAGGHRKGTHTLAFIILIGLLSNIAISHFTAFWFTLVVSFFLFSFMVKVLTDADSIINFCIAALLAGLTVSICQDYYWITYSLMMGCFLHCCGDFLTTEGVPFLLPFSKKNYKFPIVNKTGSYRELGIAGVCGLLFVYMFFTNIYIPTWEKNNPQAMEQVSKIKKPKIRTHTKEITKNIKDNYQIKMKTS